MKAYMLYDIHTKQIFVFRDIVFYEEVFPFHSVVAADNLTNPFPHLFLPNPSLDTSIPPTTQPLEHISSSSIPPDPSISSSLQQPDPPRRSSRVTKPPSYRRDFHCHLALYDPQSPFPTSSHTHLYPLSQFLSYDSLSPTYRHFNLNVSSTFEPQYYHQAVQFPQWRVAMKAELDVMELYNTWFVTTLPLGKNSIGYKWIFKTKHRSDGSIEWHKARLVAKGYTQ